VADMTPEKEGLIQKITGILFKKKIPRGVDEPVEVGASTQLGRDLQGAFIELFGPSRERFDAYREYEDMEVDSPIICSALDAVADTACAGAEGEANRVFQIEFEKENVRANKIFDELDERTRLTADAWMTIRSTMKRGDNFAEIVVDPRLTPMSISEIKALPASSMRRIPDEARRVTEDSVAFEQFDPQSGQKIASFEPWQVAHWRNQVEPSDLYGRSMLYSARRAYRQLQMIEDGLVMNRLTRSTQRYKHTIPVPANATGDPDAYVERVKRRRQRRRRWDATSGKLLLKNNPLTEETDFYVPATDKVRGDVEVLQGQTGADKIEDVRHFTRKLFSAVRVPAAYLGWEEDTSGKAQIVTIDIAFARLVRRAQMTHGIGVRQIYDTELALHGIDPASVDYDIVYASIATTDEMRRWQIELLKTQVASVLKKEALVVDDEYLLRNVLEIEEGFVKELVRKAEEEKKKRDQMAKEIANGNGIPGGQPPGEKGPPIGKEDNEPPVRGGSDSRAEALAQAYENLKRRLNGYGTRAPRNKSERVVYQAARTPKFRRELKELYELSTPLTVTRGDGPPRSVADLLREHAGMEGVQS